MTSAGGAIGIAGGGPLEQPARRARTVSDDRRLGKEPQRFLPELEPQPDRRRPVFRLVELIVAEKVSGGSSCKCGDVATRATPASDDQSRQRSSGWFAISGEAARTPPSMIGIVTIAVRETITNAMLTIKPSEIAPSTSAGQILFVRSRRMIG